MAKVAVVKGEDRKGNIKRALGLINDEIEARIKTKKSKTLFIKVNTVDINFPLAFTHPDALESVLEFFSGRFERVIVGDNSFAFSKKNLNPYKGFKGIEFTDLSNFGSEDFEIKHSKGSCTGKLSTLPKEAFTVSLAIPKSHDAFVFTGCLKNMMGCLIHNRGMVHGIKLHEWVFVKRVVKANRLKWDNLSRLIRKTLPDLSILDAYYGMEGNGPMFGTGIKLGYAMASTDGLAVDNIAAGLSGFENVPYLMLCPRPENFDMVLSGLKNLDELKLRFKPHYLYRYQVMEDYDSLFPRIDFRFMLILAKRSYRLKEKIIDRLKREIQSLRS